MRLMKKKKPSFNTQQGSTRAKTVCLESKQQEHLCRSRSRQLQRRVSILSSKTDIDDCASHPCKNNGTCTDRVNGFNCSCALGFNGSQCETGNFSQNSFFLQVLGVLNLFPCRLQCFYCLRNCLKREETYISVVAGFYCI